MLQILSCSKISSRILVTLGLLTVHLQVTTSENTLVQCLDTKWIATTTVTVFGFMYLNKRLQRPRSLSQLDATVTEKVRTALTKIEEGPSNHSTPLTPSQRNLMYTCHGDAYAVKAATLSLFLTNILQGRSHQEALVTCGATITPLLTENNELTATVAAFTQESKRYKRSKERLLQEDSLKKKRCSIRSLCVRGRYFLSPD